MKLNRQATLENDKLRIRALQENDLEALYAAANDPLIWEQHPANRHERATFEKFFKESLETGGALVIIDKQTNAIIGSSRFNLIPGKDNAIEIGWSFLMRKYWGGAYNKSFKTLMMDHAFTYLDEVLYYVDLENIRSQKAMVKLGGILLGEELYAEYKKPDKEHYIYVIRK